MVFILFYVVINVKYFLELCYLFYRDSLKSISFIPVKEIAVHSVKALIVVQGQGNRRRMKTGSVVDHMWDKYNND